ncbi:MAG: anthranilate synthase component I family protein [Pseudomonadota bacterium]
MADLKIIVKEKLADIETPVSAFLKLCRERSDAFLLESAETHETIGRYSILAFDPLKTLTLGPDRTEIDGPEGRRTRPAQDFFPLIRETVRELACAIPDGLPGAGSLMGYIGYDAVRLIEKLGPARTKDLPIARLAYSSRFVVFDHKNRTMNLAAIDRDEKVAREKIADMEALLGSRLILDKPENGLTLERPDRDRYVEAVLKGKEYIRQGDIFQVVLADRFRGRTGAKPFDLYRRLRVKSPSPYMFFLNFGDYRIVGASPETLVKVRDGQVFLRPIAGTRGRSDDPARDLALEEELKSSEKERAEHTMLVDLGRNDAGRVSRYGTVTVSPYMTVERYSHVMHLVSQVTGRLRDDLDAVDAFMAGFPAGTVSGAPKVRAMEIIDELELHPRGPYSGAVGYFGQGGEMDACIAIRMVLFQGDEFTIPVGAGIVADSIPEMEYQEIHDKAAQSIAALKTAARGEL